MFHGLSLLIWHYCISLIFSCVFLGICQLYFSASAGGLLGCWSRWQEEGRRHKDNLAGKLCPAANRLNTASTCFQLPSSSISFISSIVFLKFNSWISLGKLCPAATRHNTASTCFQLLSISLISSIVFFGIILLASPNLLLPSYILFQKFFFKEFIFVYIKINIMQI